MAVFLDFLSCAEHQSYCGKHNLVFTLSCMPLQPNNRRTKWPRNSHYTPNIQNVSVGAATNIVQPMTFSVAMALVEHSILLKCWAKIGISGAIGVSRMPLTQRQRVNIQRNLTVAGLPYWRLSMAALLRIADRVGLRAKRPQLTDCASTGSVPQSYRWPDAHRSCPDSVCGGAISSGLSRIASLRIMADSQNKQTKPVYDRTHKAP